MPSEQFVDQYAMTLLVVRGLDKRLGVGWRRLRPEEIATAVLDETLTVAYPIIRRDVLNELKDADTITAQSCPVCGAPNISARKYCYGRGLEKHEPVRWERVPMVPAVDRETIRRDVAREIARRLRDMPEPIDEEERFGQRVVLGVADEIDSEFGGDDV